MYDTVHRAGRVKLRRFARDRIVFRPVNALQSNAFVFFLWIPLTVSAGREEIETVRKEGGDEVLLL